MSERNKLLSEIGNILTDALNDPKAKVRQPVTLETYKKGSRVILRSNSLSWDAALLNISVGGYSRRIDWDNPNFYIYNPNWNHHPFDLNKMKLFQCDRAVCDDPERYHPTEGDKHADDWIPTMPPEDTSRKNGLLTIIAVLNSWLDFNEKDHKESNSSVTDETNIISVPEWPSKGVIKNWVTLLTTFTEGEK